MTALLGETCPRCGGHLIRVLARAFCARRYDDGGCGTNWVLRRGRWRDDGTGPALVRISSPTFVAGVTLCGSQIIRAAPILAAIMRRAGVRDRAGLRELVRAHRWTAEVVPPYRPAG